MTLGMKLDYALLSYPCRGCGEAIEKRGIWFKTVRRFRCAACGAVNLLTYDAKLRLFAASLPPAPDAAPKPTSAT